MRKYVVFIAALMSALFLADCASAGDSVSIQMSCTIPAIPGVNAPPFPEQNTAKAGAIVAPEPQEQQEENESPAILQEDTEEVRLADGSNALARVKTIYSR